MWSFFFIGCLYLSDIYITRILVKNKHRKKTLRDEIGLCVQNHACSIVNTFGKAYVIT